MRIGCIGVACIDTALFVDSPAYDHDSVTEVRDVVVSLGGKGMVAAIAMHQEGLSVAPLALIGRDSGVPALVSDGMGHDWLLPGRTHDCRIWLCVADAVHVAAWVSIGDPTLSAADLGEAATSYASSVDALYLSYEAVPLLQAAIGAADLRDVPIAVNLSRPLVDLLLREDPALLRRVVGSAAVVLCNVNESRTALAALSATDWRQLVRPHAEVVVTDSENGGAFSRAPFDVWQRYEAVPPASMRSVVGAGDSFNGAFLAAPWARGASLEESCRHAAAVASLCVSVPISSVPYEQKSTS